NLTVTDANGCTASTGPHVVNEPTLVVVTFDSLTHVSCNGASDGAVYVTVTGGTTNYSYLWDNGQTTEDATGLSGSTNNLTVTDANGCTASAGPHVVNEPTLIVITLDSINDVSCNGGNDGGVFISVTGGVTNYSYLWSNGQTTQDATGLIAGTTYAATITDATGCTITTGTHTVNEPTLLVVTFDSLTHVSCNGAADGAVYVTVTGGTTNYSYLWSNGQTTQDATGLSGSTNNLTVTDAKGCTVSTGPHIVNEPTLLVVTFDSLNHVSCNGAADGAVYVTVTGGTTNYSYLWDNGQTTEDATGLSGSTNNLTVTDANGCTASAGPHVVNEPAILGITIDSFKNESCAGIVDGFVSISVVGGSTPYDYNWSNGATTQDINNLSAATYSVIVTDANGCVALDTQIINNVPTITASLDLLDSVSCKSLSDGQIGISVTGGAGSYGYNWSNSSTTEDLSGIPAGNYIVTITDALGCSITGGTYTISEPDSLVLSASLNNVSCNGAADGSIDISTTGGTLNYTYSWSPNIATTEDLSNLNGGTYHVTVSDQNGCMDSINAMVISEPSAITVTLSTTTDESCDGVNDGAIDVTVMGGEPATTGYVFNWSNGANSEDLTNISGGSYSLTVSDSLGCVKTLDVNVYDPTALTLAISISTPLEGCLGEAIGGMEATASGGTGALSYTWSNSVNTALNNGLNAGTYTIVVSDANGCTISADETIGTPLMPSVTPFVVQSGTTNTTVTWGDQVAIDAGNDQSASGVTYLWTETSTIGNLNIGGATIPSTTIQPEPTTTSTYVLLVSATSTDGCVDTASISVVVEISDLLGMPNAFTPNNDGKNDRFKPVQLDPQFMTEFVIYNRWGQVMYNNANVSDGGWDGRFNGKEQPRDGYIFILKYQLPGQDEKMLRGPFTLLR
ncbi:MAG: T9SS type B sorting domain-containing protein, partial [Aureispira sp.]|nr:T9SS type B sorting domain-containing protein [Aureispira sp.]